jgi:hypothetical protein
MSFSFVACNSSIASLLSSSISKIRIRTPDEQDISKHDSKAMLPPLFVEICIVNSATSSIFPACAALRSDKAMNSEDSQNKEEIRIKRAQILIPNFGLNNEDEEEDKNNNNSNSDVDDDNDDNFDRHDDVAVGTEKNRVGAFDEIPHTIVEDDGGRCIVVASTEQELFEFITTNDQNEKDYFWIPFNSQQQQERNANDAAAKKNISANVLISSEEIQMLKSIGDTEKESEEEREEDVEQDSNNFNDKLEQEKTKQMIQRVNGQIVDAAANVMSTVSLSKLAVIYDEVESRAERTSRTRHTGSKEGKIVVIPVIDGEEQKLLKIGFTRQ